MALPHGLPPPSLTFTLLSSPPSATAFGPSRGLLTFRRAATDDLIRIPTPGILTTTHRGLIPHLSRDHAQDARVNKWVNVPFESFLEHNPPVPTLAAAVAPSYSTPLHSFLGYSPQNQIVSMCARDPADLKEMPPNGNALLHCNSLRGVRKLTPQQWNSYMHRCRPDVVFALGDIPFKNPPYSQKRMIKSIERTTAWLVELLREPQPEKSTPSTSGSELPSSSATPSSTSISIRPPPILLPLVGLTSPSARNAFSLSLLEPLSGPDLEAVKWLSIRNLEEAVDGWVVDLGVLRSVLRLEAEKQEAVGRETEKAEMEKIVKLIETSLQPLLNPGALLPPLSSTPEYSPSPRSPPRKKPLLISNPLSPHDILLLLRNIGGDIFDARWVQEMADYGVGLDFVFPAPVEEGGKYKMDIGHNLYDEKYALDYTPIGGDCFEGASSTYSSAGEKSGKQICLCAACSPVAGTPEKRLYHGLDTSQWTHPSGVPLPTKQETYKPPLTRAYIHHLLHTHEMSAHTLLVLHNLHVVEAFFEGVRQVSGPAMVQGDSAPPTTVDTERFSSEVNRFVSYYDESLRVLEDAKKMWKEVELARGKGRLKREKEKEITADPA